MAETEMKVLLADATKVRIDDLNFGNHLCHSRVVNIIHNARALFLKKYNLSEIDCFGVGLIILNLEVKYINQCFFDDSLETTVYLQELSNARFELFYEMFNKTSNKLAATASTVMGFYNPQQQRLTRVPVEFRNLFLDVRTNLDNT